MRFTKEELQKHRALAEELVFAPAAPKPPPSAEERYVEHAPETRQPAKKAVEPPARKAPRAEKPVQSVTLYEGYASPVVSIRPLAAVGALQKWIAPPAGPMLSTKASYTDEYLAKTALASPMAAAAKQAERNAQEIDAEMDMLRAKGAEASRQAGDSALQNPGAPKMSFMLWLTPSKGSEALKGAKASKGSKAKGKKPSGKAKK